jgi:hypothetical protein
MVHLGHTRRRRHERHVGHRLVNGHHHSVFFEIRVHRSDLFRADLRRQLEQHKWYALRTVGGRRDRLIAVAAIRVRTGSGGGGGSVPLAAIIGATVGGVLLVLLVAALLIFLQRTGRLSRVFRHRESTQQVTL